MTNTTQTAPELTYEAVSRILVLPLQATSVFLASGPRIFDTAGALRLPKLGGPTADPGWTGEGQAIPIRDVDFDEVTLMPSQMASLKVISVISNELARQSVVSIEAAIQQRLVYDVASKLDTQFLSASGDGITTPLGLFAYPGIQTLPVNGALSFDALLSAWGMALTANVSMNSLRLFLQPREFVALRKIKDSTGHYLLEPDVTQDGQYRVFGVPITVTARVPDTTGGTPTARAALVDMSQIAVARDLAPSVTILRELFAGTDSQGIRIVTRYDAKPLNAQAVVALTGITI